MKISFYDKIQIASHIERKISDIGIYEEHLKSMVCVDIARQIKREYGLNRKNPNLDKKYLADVHDFIDCYEPPRVIEEMIMDANSQMRL